MSHRLPYLNDGDDWSVVVPVKGEPDLSGSVLTAVLNPIMGDKTDGDPVAELSTENAGSDASITVLANDAGKAIALRLDVPVSARNGWGADRRQVNLACDVHRTVPPSSRREWLGRVIVPVVPDSGSLLPYRPNPSEQPILIGVQPSPAYLAEPISVGPQGPPGAPGASIASYDHTQSSASNLWTIPHNLNRRPSVSTFTVGGVEMVGAVQHLSADTLTVAFVVPVTGYAHVI